MNSNNTEFIMNIKHIVIPFDELELFKDEEKYQNYLIESKVSTIISTHLLD
jgi:hypothetical protein